MRRTLVFAPVKSREVRLARRPHGEPVPEDFEITEVELPEPGEGRLLVRNRFMSVDPYMRGRMNDAPSYVPPYELGKVMYGGAVGEVIGGGDEAGALVVHQLGWREHAIVAANRVQRAAVPDDVPASALLGALGMPGLTAWVGVTDIAPVAAGETVFISAAAGAVGSVAGQIAKARGCRVIGSAGAPEKVAYVRDELGFDAAFSHRDDVRAALREAAPDGIDVYFDNVGGPQLEAVIGRLNNGGRIALCGSVSQYNATEAAPGPRNLSLLVGKRARLRGFIVSDHGDRDPDFRAEVGALIAEGRLKLAETVVGGGIEAAPGAFAAMLRGEHLGKVVVRL
jgi:NADPH-dependent curcumin reductase CurA